MTFQQSGKRLAERYSRFKQKPAARAAYWISIALSAISATTAKFLRRSLAGWWASSLSLSSAWEFAQAKINKISH